jgi:hypothetical protein
MKVYHLCSNGKHDLLLTIETVDNISDISGFTELPPNLHSPFYLSASLNCGKILNISNITETTNYKSAAIIFNGKKQTVSVGQYFLADTDTEGLKCFTYKIAALEEAKIDNKYSGIRYLHYRSGLIKEKQYFANGIMTHAYRHRDDLFNSLCESYCCNVNSGKPELAFTFDDREIPVSRRMMTSNGKTFSEQKFQ